MIDYNEFKKEVHNLAIEKGWYEQKRTENELCWLICTEVVEAFEEWRADRMLPDYENVGYGRKPINLPSELADIVIRTCDMAGYFNIEIEKIIGSNVLFISKESKEYERFSGIVEICLGVYGHSLYFVCNRIIFEVKNMAKHFNIDLEKAIIEKHEFNKLRPIRHGNKKA